MRFPVFILVAFVGMVGVESSAQAACSTARFSFFPAQNDHVTASTDSDSKGCTHRYRAGSTSVFTEASIVATPKHGSLVKTENFGFKYTPTAGFTGTDVYSIKVCGKNIQGSGCSTITYETVVK